MTTRTLASTETSADFAGIIVAALAGLMLIYVAGISQLPVLHDTAHDTRHALSFPCH